MEGTEMSIFDPKADAAALNGVIDHFFEKLDAFAEKWWARICDSQVTNTTSINKRSGQ
jgi:hypothetical protein